MANLVDQAVIGDSLSSTTTLDIDWTPEQDILSFLNSDDNNLLSGTPSPPNFESFSSGESPATSPLHNDSQTLHVDTLMPSISPFLEVPPVEPPSIVPKEEPATGVTSNITVSPNTLKTKNNNGKRIRDKPTETKDSKVNLSRDDLLKLSSKELDDLTTTLASGRPLTSEEEKQLKRQRRLIKNRESAQLSRLRKKVYIDELEKKVNVLTAENEQLKSQVSSTNLDKKKLHDDVIYLQSIIKQYQQTYGPLPTTVSVPTTSSAESLDSNIIVSVGNQTTNPQFSPSFSQASNQLVTGKKTLNNQKNLKTAGVCLLLVLFSFGLLFQTQQQTNLGSVQGSNRALMSVDVNSTAIQPALPNGVAIKQESHEELPSRKQLETEVRQLSGDAIRLMNKYLPDHVRIMPEDKQEGAKKKIKIMDHEEQKGNNEKSLVIVGSEGTTASEEENTTQPVVIPNTNFRPKDNTAYFYCPQAHQLSPVARAAATSKPNPENIALLIPSSIFQTSMNQGLDPSLLEVSCQVMSYFSWPTIPATPVTPSPNSSVPH